jgi:hypothetical protein
VDVLFTPHHEKRFTVTNSGGSPSGSLTTVIAGSNPERFSINDDTCGGVALAAGASCTLDVAFSPPATGPWSARLDVTGTPGGIVSATVQAMGFV